MSPWHPLAPDALPGLLADRIAEDPGTVRVAVDGPPCARPLDLARALVDPLQARGRVAAPIDSHFFWRDASLRLEYGRTDVESYRTWLDTGALRREALDAVVEGGEYLPSLRDPATNRSTRERPRAAPPGTVVIVAGELLLGLGLPFELTVHLAMSPAARARHTAVDDAWTLPAFDDYDADVEPSEAADIVVRMDDARHPAVRGLL